MTTFTYLKYGPMSKRPYHLVADDKLYSLCGVVSRSDVGAMVVNQAPEPMNEGLVCEACAALSPLRLLRQAQQPAQVPEREHV